jgi:predicted kinase
MEPAHATTLYLFCGKIAAGKSTLARRLAERPATLLITMDHWMSTLFPTENRTLEDFARLSARLRAAIGRMLSTFSGMISRLSLISRPTP